MASACSVTSTIAPHTSLESMQKYCERQFQADSHGNYTELAMFLSKLKAYFCNRVEGVVYKDPTSASTQATGAGGATEVRVNLSEAGRYFVNGSQKEVVAAADVVLHDTTVYTGADAGTGTTTLTSGKSAIISIVATSDSATFGAGTLSLVYCKGATATTGAQVVCTDAEIQAKVGAGKPWVKICDVTINRTGDTTITQSQDNTVRPALMINVDSTFWGTVSA